MPAVKFFFACLDLERNSDFFKVPYNSNLMILFLDKRYPGNLSGFFPKTSFPGRPGSPGDLSDRGPARRIMRRARFIDMINHRVEDGIDLWYGGVGCLGIANRTNY